MTKDKKPRSFLPTNPFAFSKNFLPLTFEPTMETMEFKEKYETPTLVQVVVDGGSALCTSPVNGGNEGIGYEDWGINP